MVAVAVFCVFVLLLFVFRNCLRVSVCVDSVIVARVAIVLLFV